MNEADAPEAERTHPIILARRPLASTRLFSVEAVQLQFGNGVQREYERIVVASDSCAVLVIPVLDPNTVLLIREYAAGLDRYELGLPKGKCDPGETVLEAANRELMEEAGYGARDLTPLTRLSLAPAYLQHMTHIVLARNLYPQRLPGDEPELPEVIPWPLDALDRLVADGACSEARSIAALYLAREFLHRD